jgi:hypothetical protein
MLRCGAQKEFPVECGALCFAHTGKCVTHSLKLGDYFLSVYLFAL